MPNRPQPSVDLQQDDSPSAAAPNAEQDERSLAVESAHIAAAEVALGLAFTEPEREQLRGTLSDRLERFAVRRAAELGEFDAPATIFDPWLGAAPPAPAKPPAALEARDSELPESDEDIAFASIAELSHWLESGALTSTRLTQIQLERIARLDPKLQSCITVTSEHALAAAARADAEIADGKWRGPLHGVTYGAKDLFDTAGIRTTFGAEPFASRVPTRDATVIERLNAAGAVMLAKTSLGALAYGDRWFDRRTNNPWNLEQGSSGSSAGSSAGVAAGLFSFALGTETYGSIVSPCARCGATGLRPTFGRVPRGGAMALCWSLDKVGPIARRVEDTYEVLRAIDGAHADDPSSVALPLESYIRDASLEGLRLGFSPAWFEDAEDHERAALEVARGLGVELVEVELPEGPWGALLTILEVEAAAAFEQLTVGGGDDQLAWQDPEAWPNTFRSSWLVPAVELLQADRWRRVLSARFAAAIAGVDALIAPPYAAGLLLMTNFSGHPCLALRAGFRSDGTPGSIVLFGQLAGETRLVRLGAALEERLGVWGLRPTLS